MADLKIVNRILPFFFSDLSPFFKVGFKFKRKSAFVQSVLAFVKNYNHLVASLGENGIQPITAFGGGHYFVFNSMRLTEFINKNSSYHVKIFGAE